MTLAKYLCRQEITWETLVERLPELAEATSEVARQVTFDVKYEGYVARQDIEVQRQRRLAEKVIPASFNFSDLPQLRAEAREKLTKVRPTNLAQAGRISGITPADIALLSIWLEKGRRSESVSSPPS